MYQVKDPTCNSTCSRQNLSSKYSNKYTMMRINTAGVTLKQTKDSLQLSSITARRILQSHSMQDIYEVQFWETLSSEFIKWWAIELSVLIISAIGESSMVSKERFFCVSIPWIALRHDLQACWLSALNDMATWRNLKTTRFIIYMKSMWK